MGKKYVIDHCISCLKKEIDERTYRAYITDVLRLMGENTAVLSRGSYIRSRWIELMEEKKQDNRSADEIAEDIILRAGLSLGGETE